MIREFDPATRTAEVVRIDTRHPDGDSITGVVLFDRPALLIVREIVDLAPDGIVVLPKGWISDITHGPNEACTSEIVTRGGLDGIADPRWPAGLATVHDVVSLLALADTWPAVEAVEDAGSAMYLGPIVEVSDQDFTLHCYDATGSWESEYTLTYAEVFKIEVDSGYVRRFNAYMRTQPPPRA